MSGHDCAERADRIVDSGPNDYSCRRRRGPEQEQQQQQQQPQRQRQQHQQQHFHFGGHKGKRMTSSLSWPALEGSARARGHRRQLWQRLVCCWHQRHHHHNHFFFPFGLATCFAGSAFR